MAHVENESALMKLQLHKIVGDVGNGEAALRPDARDAGTDADLCARIFVSPDIVGIGEWPVDLARDPIASTLRLHRD
jgi:hypothetical protein